MAITDIRLFASKFLRILLIAFACLHGILLLSVVLSRRAGHPPLKKYGQVEAWSNLYAIRTCQERYFSEHGVYLECKLSPPHGGTDTEPDEWVDEGGFSDIGFEADADGRVRFQYAVTVSEEGAAFVATAIGDLDEDGKKIVWALDSRADTYPKAVKIGDDH